tara:strand:- start:52 stop:2136 length:2085 start_codon:yes stop_codon:yes gene_type:complete
MSKTLNNPKAFGRQDEAENPAITAPQLTDGADFPHTGLLKTLNQGVIGNYATSGFNASSVNTTQATFANGVVFRQGKKIDVTGSTVTIGTSYTNGYHLLVNATGTTNLTLRSPTAADLVPPYTADDVIIAVLVHTGNDPMQIQFLTFNKTENSLSIAHDNSSATYTEAATIQVSGTGVDITSSHAHLTIQNTVADGEIRIKGKKSAGPTIIDAVTFDMDDEVAIFGGAITSVGSVTAQSKVLTKNTITNNANNRILTATAVADEHNAEANATFDGSTLAINGAITGTTLTTSGLITTTGNNITAPSGSVSAVSIGAGQGGISNGGKYTQSQQLAADALGGHGITTHGHVGVLEALTPANLIDCSKEHYYVGLDTQTDATHANGVAESPTGATGEFQLLTVANETNRVAGNLTSHIYPVDTVFGGNTFFIGIQRPETHIAKTISITNITAYGMYVLVGNEGAGDPSQYAERRRINGGVWNSTHVTGSLKHIGNTRCVNMSKILCGASAFYSHLTMAGGDLDAILVKPRETITISALEITAETPGTHQQDVFNQQGLWNFPTGPAGVTGMWFLKSVTSSAGFANVSVLANSFVHIPVWMTGTTFICVGTNNIMLPSHPPIGTQYSFLVKTGTANLDRITLGGSEAHMASSFAASLMSAQDEFYELSASATTAPIAIAAGNGKTVIYTGDRNWEVIG